MSDVPRNPDGSVRWDKSGPSKPSFDARKRAIQEQMHARSVSLQRDHGWSEDKAKARAKEEMRPAVNKLMQEKDW